jgi:SdpC family antimicrobial peptide
MSKISLKQVKMPLVLMMLMLTIVLFSFIKPGATDNGKLGKYSSQEIFNAAFFADGELAKNIPAIANRTDMTGFLKGEAEIAAFKQLQQDLLQQINQANPAFLNEFEKQMKSKDPLQIKNALQKGKELLHQAEKARFSGLQVPENLNTLLAIDGKKITLNAAGRKSLDEKMKASNTLNKNSGIVVVAIAYAAIYAWRWFWEYGQIPVMEPQDEGLYAEEVTTAFATY